MQNYLQLHENDDVVIAKTQLLSGQPIQNVMVKGLIPSGHKIAIKNIAMGKPVHRYNQIIGFASKDIWVGEHVHSHNLAIGTDFTRDYAISSQLTETPPVEPRQFWGIRRPNGQVATRNYLGIISSVNCSATVAKGIADHFSRHLHPEVLKDYPHIDGVVALTHGTGCGMDTQGQGMRLLQRTLAGYALHANFSHLIMVGLGCEANQLHTLMEQYPLASTGRIHYYNIQEVGGTLNAIEKGIKMVQNLLPEANAIHRELLDLSHIVVGLQCGGSDGYSGISANPALGRAVDFLVAHGGTAILSETPEIYGAEHLLTRRAINASVAHKLLERIQWWEEYTRKLDACMDNNPSPGNKAGGLTTILEKSLGAVAKGGSSNLQAVYEYAEKVNAQGLVFMDTPGYDPVSATGQVAGGANIICFTTGRGSAYGCAPAPSIKLATNSALWRRQEPDMDINCGEIIDGTADIHTMGQKIFEFIIEVASGKKSKSELHGYGQNEFVPWQIGAVM
ncbi:MAG: altronate dehydratase family protein [Gammaproteobacteria bacterium]|nr:altronate dehydratase family protein [Gammaproteobacteria bacterium]